MSMTHDERQQAEEAAKEWASQTKIDYLDSRTVVDIKPLLSLIKFDAITRYQIIPVKLADNHLTLAINDQTDRESIEGIKPGLAPFKVSYCLVSMEGWKQLYNRFDIGRNNDVLDSGNFTNFATRLGSTEPKAMLEIIAQLAYQLNASDIHIEPGASEARIRFRIDGTLHPIINIPITQYQLLTSDLQTRAGATWGADKPQSGRVEVALIDDQGDIGNVNLRLETIPSLHGEDVVIRIFSLNEQFMNLDALKLTSDQLKTIEDAIKHPRGLVLMVGPTGSGKTTALYSIINHLNHPDIKIITLEDPIEYELSGISQLPVHSEDSELFTEKLRAVLREDPNVIMIGEIRDADTAKTALQAALTGHLVLSTFHAISSSTTISRLLDMVGQGTLLASAISLIMAQRLVRKLCDNCSQDREASRKELDMVHDALKNAPEKYHLNDDQIHLRTPVGCPVCHHFGYIGRIALIEQLVITKDIQALIAQGENVTAQNIEEKACANGMLTLLQDGIIKAANGAATLEEVFMAVGA